MRVRKLRGKLARRLAPTNCLSIHPAFHFLGPGTQPVVATLAFHLPYSMANCYQVVLAPPDLPDLLEIASRCRLQGGFSGAGGNQILSLRLFLLTSAASHQTATH